MNLSDMAVKRFIREYHNQKQLPLKVEEHNKIIKKQLRNQFHNFQKKQDFFFTKKYTDVSGYQHYVM